MRPEIDYLMPRLSEMSNQFFLQSKPTMIRAIPKRMSPSLLEFDGQLFCRRAVSQQQSLFAVNPPGGN